MGVGQSTSPPPLAQGSRGEELDSRYQDFLDYMASMDLLGTPGEERVNGFREFQEIQLRIARNPAMGTPWNPRRLAEPLCGSARGTVKLQLLHNNQALLGKNWRKTELKPELVSPTIFVTIKGLSPPTRNEPICVLGLCEILA